MEAPYRPGGQSLSLNDWGMRHRRHRLPWRHRHDHQHPRLRPTRHYVIIIDVVYVDIVIINVLVVIVSVCRSRVSPVARLHGVGGCST